MKQKNQKKTAKHTKPLKQTANSAFTLYCVEWIAYEGGEFGYPETDGYSLHVSETNRDKFIKNRQSLSPTSSPRMQANIVDPEWYRKVRDKGGDFFTEHASW